ncbi:MAG: hypothetical protein AB1512_19925 [Thermodesulfobacteriota bacterium]
MAEDKVKDLTLEVLVSIRDEIRTSREDSNRRFAELADEIRALREDTNRRFEQMDNRFERMDNRFEQMDKRFERIEKDIAQMRRDIGHIVARFDNDYLVLATEVDSMKKRLGVCESRLGISATQ